MVITLTGLTGAGKSTAAAILAQKGCTIIDADEVSHEVTARADIINEIKKSFGAAVINSDGSLNRRALGKIVFADKDKLNLLNKITHPRIKAELVRRVEEAGNGTAIIDAALVKELELDKISAAIINITAPVELRLERIVRRDGLTVEDAKNRISSQVPYDGERTDIDNSRGEAELAKRLEEVLCAVKSRA